MTTVLVLARPPRRTRVEGTLRWAVLALASSGLLASAAEPPVHWLHAGAMPPGAIGSLRLHRKRPLSGYFQPVEIRAPQGARISLAMEESYSVPQQEAALVGMLIGPVYRLQVSDIPNNAGVDLYPTVEVIDRLYPPRGLALRFPIRIELTQDELEMAARGMFITRVIYLEDPATALPVRQTKDGEQPWMEAGRGEDPLVVADTLGRPVAILRIGGRVPSADGAASIAGIDAACGVAPPVRIYDPSELCPNPCPPLEEEPSKSDGDSSPGILGGVADADSAPYPDPLTNASAPRGPRQLPQSPSDAPVQQAQLELAPPATADDTLTVIIDGSVDQSPAAAGPTVDGPGVEEWDGVVVGDGPAVGGTVERGEPPVGEYTGEFFAGEYLGEACSGGTCPTCPGGIGVCADGSILGPADEYLCDGGDFYSPAGVRADWTVVGLEQEDAIAHYDTLDGRVIVVPSNRVCIYSPRFAAVRRVVNIMAHEQPVFVNQAIEEQAPAKAHESQPVVSSLQRHRVAIDLGQQPPSLYRQRQQAGAVENLQGTMDVYSSLGAYANLQVVRTGVVDNADKPWLAASIESAVALTGVQAPQVLFNGKAAAAQVGVRQAGVIYQTSGPERPRLRLIKLASCGNALPGEVIEFTLRFDNVGDQTIGNVTIVDNLSTRFEYIPESAKSSIDATFVVTPNENESSILRWEIGPPLKPGEGGVLRFRVRVR
jgi:uncharacterized repeat protein (TIGR01451 family)